MNIDDKDRHILDIIQEDGRIPNKEIAAQVGLTPSATSERLKKLRESGLIRAIEARLDDKMVDRSLLAFVMVRTSEMASSDCIGNELAKIPEVQEVFNVAGEDCYLLKVRTKNTLSLSRLLREQIGAIEQVTSTRTTIVMESFKETSRIPLNGSA